MSWFRTRGTVLIKAYGFRNSPGNFGVYAAALLDWHAVGGGPDDPKLRIGKASMSAMVLAVRWMSTAQSRESSECGLGRPF